MNDLFGDVSDDDAVEENSCDQSSAYISIELIPTVGGGRGLVARKQLPSGFLILAEMPILIWPDIDQTSAAGLKIMAEMVLASPLAIKTSLTMFPQQITDVEAKEIELIKKHLGDDWSQLCVDRSEEEVLRVLLVLQHNGFTSGFYDSFTLLNHSCDPNCIKFTPSHSGLGRASEVWTTRTVQAGEELCICYVEPRERSSSYIAKYLLAQHFFICRCQSCIKQQHRVNSAVDIEIEDKIDNWETSINFSKDDYYNLVELFIEMWTVVEGEDADDDNSMNSRSPLSDLSFSLKGRLYKLISNTAVSYITAVETTGFKSSILPFTEVAAAFLIINFKLLQVQLLYLGSDHPDLGGTHTDLAEGIRGILTLYSDEQSLEFILPFLKPLEKGDGGATTHSTTSERLRNAAKYHCQEASRLKSLYATSKKYPDVFRLRRPGESFWGRN